MPPLSIAWDAKAVKWYLKAAKQGYAVAQNNLGWMYEIGRGVKQDATESVKWYLKAAAQGNADAQNILRRLGR
ncbi:MAG: sel1 repeat family protein [Candidatus Competibacteraceae bacterium]|nr:MAG: sel1 repeat family protein [Candidatus Competibacteraceae bacterium]